MAPFRIPARNAALARQWRPELGKRGLICFRRMVLNGLAVARAKVYASALRRLNGVGADEKKAGLKDLFLFVRTTLRGKREISI